MPVDVFGLAITQYRISTLTSMAWMILPLPSNIINLYQSARAASTYLRGADTGYVHRLLSPTVAPFLLDFRIGSCAQNGRR